MGRSCFDFGSIGRYSRLCCDLEWIARYRDFELLHYERHAIFESANFELCSTLNIDKTRTTP